MAPNSSLKCLVCSDGADSLHFGALSCRACAAFFRRKVAGRRYVQRRCDRDCKMDTGLRKLCASCRFETCLRVGMKESAVLNRIANAASSKKSADEMECSPSTSSSSNVGVGVMLQELQTAYEKLESKRREHFNVTSETTPRLANYKILNEVFFVDVKFVAEIFGGVFQEKDSLPSDQHKNLLRHFLVPFMVLEGAYKSNDVNILVMPNGDHIDHTRPEIYYKTEEGIEDSEDLKAVELFKPYWKLHKQGLKTQLDSTNLDNIEFIFLAAMMFWDFGLPGQTDECINTCRSMRTRIIEELTEYEKEVQTTTDYCYRVGQIVMLLQSMQRTMNMIHETKQVSEVYDLYERHLSMYEVMAEPK